MKDLKGYFVPIFSTFNQDGSIDLEAMRQNISYLIEEGVHGITLTGSFGEFPLLSFDERKRFYEVSIEEAAGRCAIVAGTAHASTQEVIRLSQMAEGIGVDGIMVVPPYYLLPSERDLEEHFTRISKSVSLPITIYNNPFRTGVNMSLSLLVQLGRFDNVVTIKQSSQSFFDLLELIRLTQSQRAFHVTNGQEKWAFPAFLMGAEATYGVSPFLFGRECTVLYEYAKRKDLEKGRALQLRINRVRSAVAGCQATPAACIRELAKMRGLAAGYPRAPIVELSERDKESLRLACEETNVQPVGEISTGP